MMLTAGFNVMQLYLPMVSVGGAGAKYPSVAPINMFSLV
jgi:hypothetical protein